MMPEEQSGATTLHTNRVADNYLDALQTKAGAAPSAGNEATAKASAPKQEGTAVDKKLAEDPELQLELGAKAAYTPSKWLLEQEAELIAQRRTLHADKPNPLAPLLQHRFREKDPHEDIYTWACDEELTGLCFSGGGIRSATFNLGILQGMAAKGWLPMFDYLSSVSGGGYIHSWLAGWLTRKREELERKKKTDPVMTAWRQVTMRLCPLSADPPVAHPQLLWPRQIQWLRRYSNYLTPRKGVLSGDTWAAIATWLRNVLLNQALLLLIFFALLCVPHLLAPQTQLVPYHANETVHASSVSTVKIDRVTTTLSLQLTAKPASEASKNDFGERFGSYLAHEHLQASLHDVFTRLPHLLSLSDLALLIYFIGCFSIAMLLRLEYRGARAGTDESAMPEEEGTSSRAVARRWEFSIVCYGVVLPILLFGIVLAAIVRTHPAGLGWTIKVFSLLVVLVWIETFFGGALGNAVAQEMDRRKAEDITQPMPGWPYTIRTGLGLVLLGIPAAIAGTLLAVAIAALLQSNWMTGVQNWLLLSNSCAVQMTVGGLLFFWLVPLTMVIVAGMIGKMFPEWIGEWLARVRAYTLIVGVGWILIVACALLLPGLAVRAWGEHWIKWTGVGTWAVTTLTGVISGKSAKTSGDQKSSGGILEYVAIVAPYVYIGGLALLLSWIIDWLHSLVKNWPGDEIVWWTNTMGLHWLAPRLGWFVVILLLAGVASLLGWRLDINQFSMHTFYRNRLTRCYLGASNPDRNPSPVTGFDEHDSRGLNIDRLTPDHYAGPIPIFCCALNMTTGEDLAWQERKAESFAFTPLYSGYAVGWTEWKKGLKDMSINGFVRTGMLYPGGPNVATAMAASGAAISPNWGYHTNSATAFLLTMFDARLGLWIPNPRRSGAAGRRQAKTAVPPSSPRFSPIWLISELLGRVNDTSKYVYLTDGGHFDNTGLYELVRRRCYRIVICDAEEDDTYVYEGIGAAIRKCRIDFGAEIDINLSNLSPNTNSQWSASHTVEGSIRYPETPDKKGTVTYIKASLTGNPPPKPPVKGGVDLGNMPGDLQNYKRQHPDFPHDSTTEQWFTESQLESYRRLGQSIIEGMKPLAILSTKAASLRGL